MPGRRPPGAPLDRDAYLDRWAQLHGADPHGNRLVHGWLVGVHALARPLVAARVAPDALTLLGVLVSGAAAAAASTGGRWPVLAAALVGLTGLLDGLDGAVAVVGQRVTRFGFVLDSLADRVGDGLFVLALWLLGAPGWVCLAGLALALLQEYARARGGNAGLGDVGVVTVSERPTRVAVTAMFLLGAGVLPGSARLLAGLGAGAWVGLGAVGLVQLLVVLRRRLGG